VVDKDCTATTIAGILNGIDGVCAKDGTILVITSNDKSRLDPAIFRPGRIDREFVFQNCTQEMIRRIHCKIHPKKSFADASAFAGQFKDGEKSPADIQNMLLQDQKPK
jgi:ATP-dependent 26S proteasome regulatory subunit